MPNAYVRLADLRAEVQGQGANRTNDDALMRAAERASRLIDDEAQRHFYYADAQTRYYPAIARPEHVSSRELWLPDDLLAVTTLKVDREGDGTYGLTLAAGTDYQLYPPNAAPYLRVDLVSGGQLGAWPVAARGVQIVGRFGYSADLAAAGTLAALIADGTTTTITLTAGHDVSPGDTLVIEAEQLDVRALSAANEATVTRGVNGSTAAAHSNGVAVSRRRFPPAIEFACAAQASRMFRSVQTGYAERVASPDTGGYAFSGLYPQIRDAIAPYRARLVA